MQPASVRAVHEQKLSDLVCVSLLLSSVSMPRMGEEMHDMRQPNGVLQLSGCLMGATGDLEVAPAGLRNRLANPTDRRDDPTEYDTPDCDTWGATKRETAHVSAPVTPSSQPKIQSFEPTRPFSLPPPSA
eukprot:364669-Chlamydomonas_euryale.AAC.5